MKQEQQCRAWAYARDFAVPPAVLICQMAELLGDTERRGIQTVGASQDMSSGKTLDRMGLKEALRAVRTGYADAVLVRDILQLSEDPYTLFRIMEVLQDHGAVLLCTAEDAYAGLRLKNVSQRLYQRAACFGLSLPWIEKEEMTV